MPSRETISGTIENVVYRNENNDYTVLEIVNDENELITAVGNMAMAFEGEKVTLTGGFTYHKEFGRQFAFEAYEKSLPDEVDGILQYLSSKTVKGIGPVTALKIVNRFGVDSFDVIENHPEWLADIPGITMKKAAAIAESFREQSGIRGVMMYCKDFLGKGEVTKVYKQLGAGAVGLIKENPYLLCDEKFSVPFEKADTIAKTFDVPMDAPVRILAGIEYTLVYNAAVNGHTCLPFDKLVAASAATLGVGSETVERNLCDALKAGRLSLYSVDGVRYVMRAATEKSENFIAERICEMENSIEAFGTQNCYTLIEKVEAQFGITYAARQKEALFEALNRSVMILTGGPGTGKTTVVEGLISIFDSMGYKCVLAAPTGRAAKRMSEATGREAKTIHRMLEMERVVDGDPRFNRDELNPIDENVIIVDEASMIDLSLMEALLKAVKRGTRLILIGDADQLPSVGAGNVFCDLIASEVIRTVRLTEIFRQSEESLIVTNAHRINGGKEPILNDTTKDFFFVRRDNEDTIAQTVSSLITERLPRTYGKDITDKIQVITPSKKGAGGVLLLNSELQSRINPPAKFKKEITAHGSIFREGDKVMQIANNYDIPWEKHGVSGNGVFNGDVGIIESINTMDEEIKIRYDDRVATYGFELCEELELAYAITVHKSQGSEYPVVIIPAYYCAPMLMTRNLLYTAVTRARRMVIVVGRSDIPRIMVDNNRVALRYTTLGHRIAELCR